MFLQNNFWTSRDTKDWSNDDENPALPSQEKNTFKIQMENYNGK